MAAGPIDIEFLRRQCERFPGTTEQVDWGYDLVFKVGGKVYLVVPLEQAAICLSFKCSAEDFADLTGRPGIIPSPYMARAHWVALERGDVLGAAQIKEYLRRSYQLVRAGLPKKVQAQLAGGQAPIAASAAGKPGA